MDISSVSFNKFNIESSSKESSSPFYLAFIKPFVEGASHLSAGFGGANNEIAKHTFTMIQNPTGKRILHAVIGLLLLVPIICWIAKLILFCIHNSSSYASISSLFETIDATEVIGDCLFYSVIEGLKQIKYPDANAITASELRIMTSAKMLELYTIDFNFQGSLDGMIEGYIKDPIRYLIDPLNTKRGELIKERSNFDPIVPIWMDAPEYVDINEKSYKEVTDKIKNIDDQYKNYLILATNDFKKANGYSNAFEYIKQAKTDRSIWGDHPQITALSKIFGCTIHLYKLEHGRDPYQQFIINDSPFAPIKILHYGAHYVFISKVKEKPQ